MTAQALFDMLEHKPFLDGIKFYEGFFAKQYYCPAGVLTIGYGHVVKDSEKSTLVTVTKEEATQLLIKELKQKAVLVDKLMPELADEPDKFRAMVDWVFNLGEGNLKVSTLRRKWNNGNRNEVSAEILKWDKATVKGKKISLPGLTKRRRWEKQIFDTGNYTVIEKL